MKPENLPQSFWILSEEPTEQVAQALLSVAPDTWDWIVPTTGERWLPEEGREN